MLVSDKNKKLSETSECRELYQFRSVERSAVVCAVAVLTHCLVVAAKPIPLYPVDGPSVGVRSNSHVFAQSVRVMSDCGRWKAFDVLADKVVYIFCAKNMLVSDRSKKLPETGNNGNV